MSPLAPNAQQIIAAYAEMAERRVEESWDPYLLTFMFHQLAGSPAGIARQMEREVERVYSRFLTRAVRNPRSAGAINRLPVWICSPDYPVFKHEKQDVSDVTINDGRHVHAVHLQPPRSRLCTTVDQHFVDRQDLYVQPGFPLLRIDARPITNGLGRVVGYALKALTKGRIGSEEVFVLPRSRSEMA